VFKYRKPFRPTCPGSNSATSAAVREGRMSLGRPRYRWDIATRPGKEYK